jgi:uncharacterized protein YlxP (DUF503 family)
MIIGTLMYEFYLPGISSLKEKRFILKSLKDRTRNQFNVSIAEIDHLDKWQRCGLGIACVSNSRRHLDSMLSKVTAFIEKDSRIEIIDQITEII